MHSRFGCGLLEGVEIYHHHVDRLNAVLGNCTAVRGILPPMQDASVNLGVQRFDPPIEHLGEPSKFGDVFHCDAGVTQQLGCAAGRDEFDAQGGELAGELH